MRPLVLPPALRSYVDVRNKIEGGAGFSWVLAYDLATYQSLLYDDYPGYATATVVVSFVPYVVAVLCFSVGYGYWYAAGASWVSALLPEWARSESVEKTEQGSAGVAGPGPSGLEEAPSSVVIRTRLLAPAVREGVGDT